MNARIGLALIPLALAAGLAVWLTSADDAPSDAAPVAPQRSEPPKAKRARAPDATTADVTPEAPDPQPPKDAASLVVRVTLGGVPRSGSTVTVTDADCETWTGTTGGEGTSLFAALPPGQTEICIDAPGALAASRTVALKANEKQELEIALAAAAALEGVLVDAAGGAPLVGAEIEVVVVDEASGEERPAGEAVADEKGRWRVEQLPAAGRVVVRILGTGRKRFEVPVTLGKDAVTRIEVPRDAGGRMTGIVRDPDGRGLRRATVALRRRDAAPHDPPERVADSGADGAYAIDVPLGVELIAFASATGWAESSRTEPWTLDAASPPMSRDFALRRPASLSVDVPPEPDEAPRLVMVRLDEEAAATALSSGYGTAARGNLTPGLHRVRVSSDGYLPVDRRVELAEGEEKTIEVKLERGLEITGRVVGADGKGIDGAVVIASDPDLPRGAKSMRTDLAQEAIAENGEFRILGLGPGQRRVRAYIPAGPESARQMVGVPSSGVTIVIAKGTRISLHAVLPPGMQRPAAAKVIASADILSPNIPSQDEIELGPEPRPWAERSVIECEVAPGHSWLRVIVPGCAPVVLKIAPVPAKLVDLGDVRFERPLVVGGHVRDAQGKLIDGASVWTTLIDAGAKATSRADGTFAVEGLAAGAVILRAESGDRFGAVVVDAGETTVELVLRPKGWIAGTVTDADGFPVRDAVVAILHGFANFRAGDEGREESARTDAQGRFRVAVAAGPVRVHAGAGWKEADVPPGGEMTIAVTGR